LVVPVPVGVGGARVTPYTGNDSAAIEGIQESDTYDLETEGLGSGECSLEVITLAVLGDASGGAGNESVVLAQAAVVVLGTVSLVSTRETRCGTG
jgi:hypothetical protein